MAKVFNPNNAPTTGTSQQVQEIIQTIKEKK